MNFIAHIHLSGTDAPLLVGNYIADLIRHKDVATLTDDIKAGVLLHRHIDTYTDNHVINKKMRSALYPRHRKYAAVLLDIYYDYFLIRHWESFGNRTFDETCEFAYHSLADYSSLLPETLQARIQNLLTKRWLGDAYGSIEGLEKTFYFLKKRMSKPELIESAIITLTKMDNELESAFLAFYPQLIKEVGAFKISQ